MSRRQRSLLRHRILRRQIFFSESNLKYSLILLYFPCLQFLIFAFYHFQGVTAVMGCLTQELIQQKVLVQTQTTFATTPDPVEVDINLRNQFEVFVNVIIKQHYFPWLQFLISGLFYFQGVTTVMECLTQELIQLKVHVQTPTTFATTLDHVEVDIFLRIKIEVFLNFIKRVYLPGFHF